MLRYNEDMLGSNMAKNFTLTCFSLSFIVCTTIKKHTNQDRRKYRYKEQRNRCKRKAKGMPRMKWRKIMRSVNEHKGRQSNQSRPEALKETISGR